MMTFDPKKPVQTRDGRPARIICMDRNHIDGPIVALITNNIPDHPHEGEEELRTYHIDGKWVPDGVPRTQDLFNVPVKRSRWQTVTSHNGWLFDTKEAANDLMKVIGHFRYDYEDDVIVKVEFEPCPK